jgi:hypothetical protein
MKKHTIIIVLTSLVILAVICVIGNVITVADKVSELSPWLGYSFYAVLLALTVAFVVWPTMKIIFTPELEPSGELMHEEDRKEAEHMVRKSAQNVFILTSVSQNGALDVFTCLSMNISLINRLVELRGKRPSLGQILRLYIAVASSSVLIASADEALDDLNLGELLGMSGVNVTGTVFKSAANGMVNSFVTLRVGMTALKYLEAGSLYFIENKKAIRKEIRRKAVKYMPAVVGGGVKNGILGLKNLF